MAGLWTKAAFAIALVSAFWHGFVVNDLAGGITELPRHWWSAPPILGLVVAAALGAIGHSRRGTGQGR